jgi:radical SAM superfamily enzyme YgiQ (UPF0313 family)
MKITFINPKSTEFVNTGSSHLPLKIRQLLNENPKLQEKLEFSKSAMGALGILSVVGVVPENIEVEFLDENMESIDLQQSFDLVAIGGNTAQMDRALAICDILRKRRIPIVVGGTSVITFPDQYIKRNVHVILGEGEKLFSTFLEDFINGHPKQIYEASITDSYLDPQQLPIPRYDLAAKYPYSMVGLQVSRGCPYDCSFCQVTRIYGPKYRHKPVERVIQELKIVKAYWPDSFLFFYDDNPFFKKTFATKLFQKIAEEGIELGRWGANANVSLYKDEDLLQHMTQQGPISFLGIGLESLSKKVLNSINNNMKHSYVTEYEHAMAIFKQHAINPVAYFMFGFENSQKKELDDIVDFCVSNDIDGILTRVTPMPGTAVYERLKTEYEQLYGTIKKSHFAEFGLMKKFMNEKCGIPDDLLQNYLSEAYCKLYADIHFCHSDGPIPFYFLF